MAEIKVTKEKFKQQVQDAAQPVLVDFWASWCGPCRMLNPVLEQIAQEYAGKLTVGKINVDEEPELAAQFRVASIPMLALFQNGKVVKTVVGYRTKAQIVAMLGL